MSLSPERWFFLNVDYFFFLENIYNHLVRKEMAHWSPRKGSSPQLQIYLSS